MELELRNKTAIVTGGSRGLGRSICLSLAAEGANVVVNYAGNAARAEDVKQEIGTQYGVRAMAVQADVSQEQDVERLFETILQEFPQPDILVNNAGICPQSLVKDMDFAMWQQVMEVNVNSVFLMSRKMVQILIAQQKPGRIVNIGSQAAFNGSATGKSHYATSKGAVHSLTVSLAREVAQYGILVNSVAPGMMRTDMTEDIIQKDAERYQKSIPIGRIADTDEIARVVTFLVSEGGAYMTGTSVGVSGGLSMR